MKMINDDLRGIGLVMVCWTDYSKPNVRGFHFVPTYLKTGLRI